MQIHNPETKKHKHKHKRKKGERTAAAAEVWVGGGEEEVGRLVMRGGGREEGGKKLLRKKGAVVSVSAELPHFLYRNKKLNKRAMMIAVDDLLTLVILP